AVADKPRTRSLLCDVSAEHVGLQVLRGLVSVDGVSALFELVDRRIHHRLGLSTGDRREREGRLGIELRAASLVDVNRLGAFRRALDRQDDLRLLVALLRQRRGAGFTGVALRPQVDLDGIGRSDPGRWNEKEPQDENYE